MNYSNMCDSGSRSVCGGCGNSCEKVDQVIYLIVADLGCKVAVDLSLGKLICNLSAIEYG